MQAQVFDYPLFTGLCPLPSLSTSGASFSELCSHHCGLLALMLRIVLLPAYKPQIRLHGLLAACLVFLRQECILVGGELREVALTGLDHRCYRCEALAGLQLIAGRLGAALRLRTHVQTVTILALGGRYAVGSQEHFCARVLTVLARFGECARHMVDTCTPCYFCHSRELWLGTTRDNVAHMISRHALALRSEYRFASIPPEKREPL